MMQRLIERLEAALWETPSDAAPMRRTAWRRIGRLLMVIVRDITAGELALRAMGLVYITLLSMVPLLALSLALLKALGVRDELETILRGLLGPLGPEAGLVAQHIIGFIGNIHAGVLGSAGIALLFYTSISIVQRVESSLNFIWHVRETRPLSERFSRYLSMMLVGPILVISIIAIVSEAGTSRFATWLIDADAMSQLGLFAGALLPHVVAIVSLALIYRFVPNARVGFGFALLGALVGSALWQAGGWGFGRFLAASGSYEAIYSGFAVAILFLIWIYLTWLIVLIGASVAFYGQYPAYVVPRAGEPRLSHRSREHLALFVMGLIVQRFGRGMPGLTTEEIAQRARVPRHSVDIIVNMFEHAGMIVRGQGREPALLPARDPAQVSVASLLQVVRTAGEDGSRSDDRIPRDRVIEQWMALVDESLRESLGHVNLDQLMATSDDKTESDRSDEPPAPAS